MSVFINKSQMASIVGYGIAVFCMAIAQIVGNVIYVIPYWLPWYYHLLPTFTFCRAIQHVSVQCFAGMCFGSISDLYNPES